MTNLTREQLDQLPPERLKDLAKRGILRVTRNGVDPAHMKYTDLEEYKKHARWKGIGITLREASRLFAIPVATISQWTNRGLITVIDRTNREIFLDKADVAYCAEIRAERPGAGNSLFNPDRTPFVPATRQRT